MARRLSIAIASIAVVVAVTGCGFLEKPKERIPREVVVAPSGKSKRMVIVLPGYGDNLAVLKKSGIASAIQRNLPDTDVVLVQLSIPYYMQGRAVQRLHEEIVLPAKERGYREIYLAGASMGGMGVLLYEHEYPNEMSGLLLMAPFMGDAALLQEIDAAGGLANWNAGPAPEQMSRDDVPREEWRVVQSWTAHPERVRDVWIVCGADDRLYPAAQMIAKVLPQQNFFTIPGGHKWRVWTQGAAQVFSLIDKR